MAVIIRTLETKSLDSADEVRTLPKTKVEVCRLEDHTLMRATFEPGWKWSECVKPQVGTTTCEIQHLGYCLSGQMKVKMNDGKELLVKPGDFVVIPPGHDAWVMGNEPTVMLDFVGGATYGKRI
ncbi:MAG: cupin domain-containing protein [Armatimonadetes bacterium]|nr:cupin domain-containing protein [Armatimonadota bacterium]